MWLLLAVLIAYSYAFIAATTTDSNDQQECRALVSGVRATHGIPVSVSQTGSPAIFCEVGVHFPLLQSYDDIFVYGVLDAREQDAILTEVRSARGSARRRPVLVQFIAKENWKTWSDPATGRSGGSRGPEIPLRKAWIE